MKLVFVTQTLDPGTARSRRRSTSSARSPREQTMWSFCAEACEWDEIPANVEVRTFDARGKVGRALAFERELASALRGADAVLVHMVPTFLALAAPLARVRGVCRCCSGTRTGMRAGRCGSRRGSPTRCSASMPRASRSHTSKLHAIGHAIDVDAFAPPAGSRDEGPVRLLAFGRTARWKGLGTLLDAFELASTVDVSLELRGPSLTPDEVAHRAELSSARSGDGRVSRRAPRSRAPRCRRSLAGADVVVSPAEPRVRRDARQGGLRGSRLRTTGRHDERGARAVPRGLPLRARRAAARSRRARRDAGGGRRRVAGDARPRSARSCAGGSSTSTRSTTGPTR